MMEQYADMMQEDAEVVVGAGNPGMQAPVDVEDNPAAEASADEAGNPGAQVDGAAPFQEPIVVWPNPPGFGPPRSAWEEQALNEIPQLPVLQPPGYTFLRIFQAPIARDQILPRSISAMMRPYNGQFIGIRVLSGKIYMVKVVEEDGQMVLSEGWSVLAICEGLRHNQVGFFSRIYYLHFDLIVYFNYGVERPPVVEPYHSEDEEEIPWDSVAHIEARNVLLTPEIKSRVTNLWLSSVDRFTIYTAKMTSAQITKRRFYFSLEFSSKLPNEDIEIRMKFKGSNHITVAPLRKIRGISYIIEGKWGDFAQEHEISAGSTCIFRFNFIGGQASLCVFMV